MKAKLLSLREALTSGKLEQFIKQEEVRGAPMSVASSSPWPHFPAG